MAVREVVGQAACVSALVRQRVVLGCAGVWCQDMCAGGGAGVCRCVPVWVGVGPVWSRARPARPCPDLRPAPMSGMCRFMWISVTGPSGRVMR
ncbi:hypothetical protein SHIRM173S_05959 [Streptomyces hirsutus]